MGVKLFVEGDGASRAIDVHGDAAGWTFEIEGRQHAADVRQVTGDCLSVLLDGASYKVHFLRQEGKTIVCVRGETYELEVLDEREKALRDGRKTSDSTGGPGASQVRSRIPGKVVAVHVAAGDRVESGAKLLVLEAMKMENEIRAAADGIVARVAVAPGDTVEMNAVLVEFEVAD